MRPNKTSNTAPDHKETNYEDMKEFVALRNKELDIQKSRIEARANSHNEMKQIALADIDDQRKDRQKSRNLFQAESTRNKIFIVVLVLILVAFSISLVWLGQGPLTEKAISYLMFLVAGVFGGYGYARFSQMQGPTQNEQHGKQH